MQVFTTWFSIVEWTCVYTVRFIADEWTTDILGMILCHMSHVHVWCCQCSCFLGRLLRVDLIQSVSNVCPYVRPSTKSFSDFNEICYVGRGWWVKVWSYAVWPDPRSRSRALESRKFNHFQRLSSPLFIMGAGKWPRILKLGTIPKVYPGRIFVLVFVSLDFEVGSK